MADNFKEPKKLSPLEPRQFSPLLELFQGLKKDIPEGLGQGLGNRWSYLPVPNKEEAYPYLAGKTVKDVHDLLLKLTNTSTGYAPKYVDESQVDPLRNKDMARYDSDKGTLISTPSRMDFISTSGYDANYPTQRSSPSIAGHEWGHAVQAGYDERTKKELDTLRMLRERLPYKHEVTASWESEAEELGGGFTKMLSPEYTKARKDSVLKGLLIPQGSVLLKPELLPKNNDNLFSVILDEMRKRAENAGTYYMDNPSEYSDKKMFSEFPDLFSKGRMQYSQPTKKIPSPPKPEEMQKKQTKR